MNKADQNRKHEDPLIDEVRAVRQAIEEEVGGDVRQLAEHVRRIGETYRRQISGTNRAPEPRRIRSSG